MRYLKSFVRVTQLPFSKALAACVFGVGLMLSAGQSIAQNQPEFFNDQPLSEEIILPDWFKVSFLELKDDLQEALANGKRGIIVYFGQKHCPYCKAQLENNWGQHDILSYTLQHFDVIAIDVLGQRQVVDFDGTSYTEKQFAIKHKTNFTPTIVFYVKGGKVALKLRGYRPPYQFRAALEYVADKHYAQEPFADYLARAETAYSYGKDALNEHESFLPPPYALDRSRIPAGRPLLVAFERRRCHACDVLHAGPLEDTRIKAYLKKMDVVQLDMHADTPVITPSGQRTTAHDWAKQLKLDYAPTLVFFDEHGREIIRIDSVVWFFRLRNVLEYVVSKGYLEYPTYQAWKQHRRKQPQ